MRHLSWHGPLALALSALAGYYMPPLIGGIVACLVTRALCLWDSDDWSADWIAPYPEPQQERFRTPTPSYN